YEEFHGGQGNDTIDGGAGIDLADYFEPVFNFSIGVNVNLATGIATDQFGGTDHLLNIEGIRGTLGNDFLVGNSGDNFFEALQGQNQIDGGLGNDTVRYDSSSDGVVVNLSAISVNAPGFGTLAGLSGADLS